MKKKGSLTVEATISFTVFLGVMFLLLTLVKLVLVMTILNNATVETAKTIATAAYPISFLNEAQSGLEDLEDNLNPTSLSNSLVGTGQSALTTALLGGEGMDTLKVGAGNIIKDLVGGFAVNILKGDIYELKGQGVKYLCGKIVQGYIEESGIHFEPDKLILKVTKIPQTEKEFETVYPEDGVKLSEKGSLTMKPVSETNGAGHFDADDVVICLEYPYQIALPLLPAFEVTLRSISIEHAWTNGTCNGPSRKEGIPVGDIIFDNNKQVWIPTGGYGKRYHKQDCHLLWKGSNSPSTVNSAKAQGFTACKVCRPDDKDKN